MSRANKLSMGMKGTVESDVTLELDRAGVQGRVTARQGDALVHRFRVRLNLRGRKYTPASATLAQLYGLRADGETVSCDGMVLPDGQVELIPGGGFFACGGPVICRLVLRGDDGGELYSPAFAIDAEPAFGEGTDPVPAEQYSRMEELLLQVLDAKRVCESLAADMNEYGVLSDGVPLSNGTASPGTADTASRADHVHPTDESRMPAIAGMKRKGTFTSADKFSVLDAADGTMKYAYWNLILSKLSEHMTPVISNATVSTAYFLQNGANGLAAIPDEHTGYGIIALQSDITNAIANIPAEEWTFTLADGTTVTKKVMLG